MEQRGALSDEQWGRLAPTVESLRRRGPRPGSDRRFIEAVVWVLRTGAPWRDLPEAFGLWNTVYQRFRRWALAGWWDGLLRSLASRDEGTGPFLLDSTIVKAHPHTAGARRRTGGQRSQALGRSRGGFTTKIHAIVSSTGRLVRYALTGGQAADVVQALDLVLGLRGRALVGDRAYDSNPFLATIEAEGMAAVIPSRIHRKVPRPLDKKEYARRNVIERFFGRVKAFRRVATRYDKTAASFAGMLVVAASLRELSGWMA